MDRAWLLARGSGVGNCQVTVLANPTGTLGLIFDLYQPVVY